MLVIVAGCVSYRSTVCLALHLAAFFFMRLFLTTQIRKKKTSCLIDKIKMFYYDKGEKLKLLLPLNSYENGEDPL